MPQKRVTVLLLCRLRAEAFSPPRPHGLLVCVRPHWLFGPPSLIGPNQPPGRIRREKESEALSEITNELNELWSRKILEVHAMTAFLHGFLTGLGLVALLFVCGLLFHSLITRGKS